MKNYFRVLAFVALVPMTGFAQGSVDADVNAELERLYQEQSAKNSQGAQPQGTGSSTSGTQVNVSVQAQPHATANQSSEQGLVQKQATTVIQASPLVESKAEALRRARQDAELSTEQTIVEKLEESRMEDERRRAEILFGDKFNSLQSKGSDNQNTQAVADAKADQGAVIATEINGDNNKISPVIVQEQAVVAAAPVEVVKEPKEEYSREAMRSEITAALSDLKAKDDKPEDKSYISALAGMGEYPDAQNIRGKYSLGFNLGRKIQDRFLVEGMFQYTNFELEQVFVPSTCYAYQCYPVITDIKQYNMGLTTKYQLLSGVFRPTIGGTMSYVYRTYKDTQFSLYNSEASSHALDLGLATGVDLEFTPSFALGIDFKYMWNLSYKVDNSVQKSFTYPTAQYAKTSATEELNYYLFSVVGRVSF